jgi:hypothetical protein
MTSGDDLADTTGNARSSGPREVRAGSGAHALPLLAGTEYYVDSASNAVQPFIDPNSPTQRTTHVSYGDATAYGQALLETPWANISASAPPQH